MIFLSFKASKQSVRTDLGRNLGIGAGLLNHRLKQSPSILTSEGWQGLRFALRSIRFPWLQIPEEADVSKHLTWLSRVQFIHELNVAPCWLHQKNTLLLFAFESLASMHLIHFRKKLEELSEARLLAHNKHRSHLTFRAIYHKTQAWIDSTKKLSGCNLVYFVICRVGAQRTERWLSNNNKGDIKFSAALMVNCVWTTTHLMPEVSWLGSVGWSSLQNLDIRGLLRYQILYLWWLPLENRLIYTEHYNMQPNHKAAGYIHRVIIFRNSNSNYKKFK